MSDAHTEREKSYFRAVEYGDGTPWIICEPQGPEIPALSGGFIGLDLEPGTSLEDAGRIAAMLRSKVTHVSVTLFDKNARHRANGR